MQRFYTLLIIGLISNTMIAQGTITPPQAAKKPKQLTIHNDTRIDNYYWLNDREDKEVIRYLKDENTYTERMMAHTRDFQEKLFKEMVGRIKQTDLSVPYMLRGYSYYTRFEEGKEYPVYCRKKGGEDGQEEILLDVNSMAKGKNYYDVAGLTVSPDNRLLAFGVDEVSRRKYTLYIKDLKTGEIYKESVPNTDGSYVWANDNETLFYDVKDDETLRTFKIRKHTIGKPSTSDVDVFEEKDETFGCYVYKSKSEDYIFIGSYSTLTSEIRFIRSGEPDSEFTIIQPRQRDLLYDAEHYGNDFYIRTNLDAKNFKLVKTPVSNTGKENWVEVIPHRKDVLLDSYEIFKDFLVLNERKEGLMNIRIRNWSGSNDYYIEFDEPTYDAYTTVNPEFNTTMLRFNYTSLVTPSSVYDYNMQTREMTLRKQQEVVGGYNKEQYTSERLYATAEDGTLVPVSLVYRNDKFISGGNTPLLLYGYGSYGASMDPYFSSVRLSLLDRGFVFAIAHIRGGQEMGREWYENGKLLKKKNTFTDFIDCAKFLVDKGYTSPQHLYAMGGSAGGLLMGAVVNMRPDLFNGVVAQVPFVDVVTTMLDESIPLTTGEFDEWGNPKDQAYYQYIKSYSPYDNVEAKAYPNMLVTTGLHDSQVQYWEPAKWVAKLRELKTDKNKLLLWCEMEAGHGGKSGRFERLKEIAMEYVFLLDLEGIKE